MEVKERWMPMTSSGKLGSIFVIEDKPSPFKKES